IGSKNLHKRQARHRFPSAFIFHLASALPARSREPRSASYNEANSTAVASCGTLPQQPFVVSFDLILTSIEWTLPFKHVLALEQGNAAHAVDKPDQRSRLAQRVEAT